MRIYLVGFMGSGKTSFGKRLARKIGFQFFDIDEAVENMSGQKVAALFSNVGEAAFREMERQALHDTAQMENTVVSTGGGTPCHGSNMDFMLANGTTVYLRMSIESLTHRLENARRERPLIRGLSGDALQAFIAAKLDERERYYERAHCIIKGETVKTDHVISLVFGK